MSKESDLFAKYYKAFKPHQKEFTPAAGAKMKKDMLSWLETTWTKEDAVADAVEKARMGGLTGSKPADFMKDKEFVKALAEWKKAVTTHHANVKELTNFADRAKALHDELEGKCNDLEKALKKAGSGMSDIKTMALLKEARRALPDLKKASGKASGLPGHAVMYAVRLQRSVEVIVKQRLSKIDPKELPKMLEEAGRKKTTNEIKGLLKGVQKYAAAATASAESDADKARKALELARKELYALEKLDDACKEAAKKMKKEIAASKDKTAILAIITAADKAMKKAQGTFDDAGKKLEAAAPA